MKTIGYTVTTVEYSKSQERPEDRIQLTKSQLLATKIDKYYRDCVLRSDFWGEAREVQRFIEEAYGVED